jgi:hypothetical protein
VQGGVLGRSRQGRTLRYSVAAPGPAAGSAAVTPT